eukprot:364447-Chlamydomonas_euryale.AAC.14
MLADGAATGNLFPDRRCSATAAPLSSGLKIRSMLMRFCAALATQASKSVAVLAATYAPEQLPLPCTVQHASTDSFATVPSCALSGSHSLSLSLVLLRLASTFHFSTSLGSASPRLTYARIVSRTTTLCLTSTLHFSLSCMPTASSDSAALLTNFESEKPSSYYSELYRRDSLAGGHVIMLGADADSK